MTYQEWLQPEGELVCGAGVGKRERGDQNAFKAQTKSAETQDELQSRWQGREETRPAVMRREVAQPRLVPG